MTAHGMWLVRHAATTTAPGVAIGSSDPPLSAAGLERAAALAAEFANRPLTAIYSSDRRRALATARAIASVHRLETRIDARLRELDFGVWEGRRLADLRVEEPEAAAAWEKDLLATPPSFGESLAEMHVRLAAFLEDARASLEGDVAVVAHRGSLAVLRSLITGEPFAAAFAPGLELGAAMRVAIEPA